VRGHYTTAKFWLQLTAFGAIGGLGYGALSLIGSSAAVGIVLAWKLSHNGVTILTNAGYGALLVNAIPAAFIIFLFLMEVCRYFTAKFFNEKTGERVTNVLFITFLFMIMFPMVPFSSFKAAKDIQRTAFTQNAHELSEVSDALASHKRTLGEYKNEIRSTLAAVDHTSNQISEMKKNLEHTLSQFEEQSAFVDAATKRIQDGMAQQAVVEQRISELEKILDGREPLTRQDVANSKWEGFYIGFLSSLFASLMIYLFSESFRKKLNKQTSTSQ